MSCQIKTKIPIQYSSTDLFIYLFIYLLQFQEIHTQEECNGYRNKEQVTMLHVAESVIRQIV
jgi:hypothetical protein